MVWPNGVPQAEFDAAADRTIVAEQRLKGSCPWVFADDGTAMRFVTDFRWRSPLGVRLNAQEIRNSAWPGPLNDTILELSESSEFHSLLGIKIKERSGIYKEMRDAEFVLRYFAFRDTWSTFSGGMMRHMDSFMADNQHVSEVWLAAVLLPVQQDARVG